MDLEKKKNGKPHWGKTCSIKEAKCVPRAPEADPMKRREWAPLGRKYKCVAGTKGRP